MLHPALGKAQHHSAQLNWAHGLETTTGAPDHMSAETNGAADPSAGATHCLHTDQAALQFGEYISPNWELENRIFQSFHGDKVPGAAPS